MPVDGVLPPESDELDVPYLDEPLDSIVQDSLDIRCEIGGREYSVLDVEVHLTEGSSSNYAMGKIVPDGHNVLPSTGDPLGDERPEIIKLDVDNELMEVREGSGEITRIFTGVISNSSRIEQGAFEFMAFWPGYNEIQNGSIVVQSSTPTVDEDTNEQDGTGQDGRVVDRNSQRQYTEFLAEQIGKFVTEETLFDFSVNLTENGTDINGVDAGVNTQVLVQSGELPLTSDGNNEGLLQRVVKASNAVWEVDRYGNFNIGPPTPDGDVPTAVTSHKIRYLTDTSAGKQSPAWQSIVVIGDDVVSQDGWAASAQINENPQKFAKPITETGDAATVDTSNLAEPVFEYVNLEINTAAEAKHVLEKIRNEIIKQQAGGEVTVVGHPEIWPGDAIELPDSINQPYGAERFAVSKVIHRLNNEDGFLTKIEVMGQTDAAEASFSNEIPAEVRDPARYDTKFSQQELERTRNNQQ